MVAAPDNCFTAETGNGCEMIGSVNTRLKRKLDETDLFDQAYHEQRQSILNISMCKLRTVPTKRVEPPLLRSVLIFNTLKFIESELCDEGISIKRSNSPSILPQMQSDALTLDPPPPGCQNQSSTALVVRTESKLAAEPSPYQNPSRENNSKLDQATSVSACPVSMETNSELLTIENSATSNTDVNCNLDYKDRWSSSMWGGQTNNTCDFYANECPPLSSPAAVERVEDLLADVDPSVPDVSMYEDLFSPLTSKLTPLSADELMLAFPSNDAYSSYVNTGSCRSDLLTDDLDHIMQVLIGI